LLLELYYQALEGDWSEKKLAALLAANYLHMGRTVVEFLRLPALRPEQISAQMRLEGEEQLHQAIAKGKGVIILTAHFGNWELLGARLAQVFGPNKFYVIAQPQRDARLTQLMDKIRAGQGVEVIPRGKAARETLQVLRQGAGVGILLDIDMKERGVFVDFMGQSASTSTSVAAFALRTGAAVLPIFAHRQPDGTHVGKIFPPVTLTRSGDGDQDLYINTAHFSQIIGEQVRARPEQWIWLPDRWRSASRKR
jgi:KDO2-lipid IV(A) lauroyltransferase